MKCYICGGKLVSIGVIPFGQNIGTLPCTDFTPIEYHRCSKCSFICCLDMLQWSNERFAKDVYNKDYIILDPGYGSARATNVANLLGYDKLFGNCYSLPRHLDYGSGENHLSRILNERGWNSTSYDPFTNIAKPEGKFKLITAIEVLEHSTNIFNTIEEITSYLDRDGVIIFTTKFCTSETPISWWYICARSGHIGIQSANSMKIVAKKFGYFLHSMNEDYHVLQASRNNLKQLIRGYV